MKPIRAAFHRTAYFTGQSILAAAFLTTMLSSAPFLIAAHAETEPAVPQAATEPAAASAEAAQRKSPQATIDAYLGSLQKQDFSGAYDYIASTMRAGKEREEWAKEQQYIVQMGEVKIFGFQTFEAVGVTEDRAKVPNILKSQDKFLNQLGLDEYELYELVLEEGVWRIDYQTLVEGAERAEYFPEQ